MLTLECRNCFEPVIRVLGHRLQSLRGLRKLAEYLGTSVRGVEALERILPRVCDNLAPVLLEEVREGWNGWVWEGPPILLELRLRCGRARCNGSCDTRS